jgi:hypothetical protein
MTVTAKNIIPSKVMEAAQTTQYAAVNCTCQITKFTATNTSASNALINVHLVTAGGSAGTSNLIESNVSIPPGATYNCPYVVGHVLQSNGFISTSGTASALTIRASGNEIT